MNTKPSQSLLQYKDFRLYLQGELVKRCKQNPRYSLRAFARSLGIHHSVLSRIIRGERELTERTFKSLAQEIDLTPTQIALFQESVHKTNNSIREFQDLSLDAFNIISEWYHDAILELMRLKNFKQDPKWIAKKIGIKPSEVSIAIERLIRLNLISVNPSGKWVSKAEHTEVGLDGDFTNAALKRYQKQVLEMAIEHVDNTPRLRRHNISSTIAIDSRDLEKLKKMINEFRRNISRFAQRKSASADEVYQLGISFYPLTKEEGS